MELRDPLPPLLLDPEILYESPAVTSHSGTYVWQIEDLEPGAGGEIRFRARVDPRAGGGTLLNMSEISAAGAETVPEDNSDSVSITVLSGSEGWWLYLPLVVRNTG